MGVAKVEKVQKAACYANGALNSLMLDEASTKLLKVLLGSFQS